MMVSECITRRHRKGQNKERQRPNQPANGQYGKHERHARHPCFGIKDQLSAIDDVADGSRLASQ